MSEKEPDLYAQIYIYPKIQLDSPTIVVVGAVAVTVTVAVMAVVVIMSCNVMIDSDGDVYSSRLKNVSSFILSKLLSVS